MADAEAAEPEEAPVDDAPLLRAAEGVLSDALGGVAVRLEVADVLRQRYRNRVLRCQVVEALRGDRVPATVVLKVSTGENDDAYDPQNDRQRGTAWRFFNEWAGTRYLNERFGTRGEPPPCARLWGADRAAALIVLEDLGEGASLADRLQGEDPDAAVAALDAYARALGRLHAATAGDETGFLQIRQAAAGTDATGGAAAAGAWLTENVAPFREQCAALGVPPAPGFEEDAEIVQRAMDEPGPFLAFAPGDTCPDNHRLRDDGTLRFFDFEFAGFRHALLDAAYLHLPFPTCWCVNRLPDGLPDRLEDTYRAELVAGCPEAADDATFAAATARACAYWTVTSLSWSLEHALREDGQWGLATNRQRHLLRLDNFAALAERTGQLPAIGETARRLCDTLRTLWPPEQLEPMPVYPPFRGGPTEEKIHV